MTAAPLSVVIVNWNTKDLLLQVLGDFLPYDQEREVEVIVVDNASEDGSVDAARAAFPGVRCLVQETNLGFAGGVNKGFDAATHPLVLLLNTDVRTSAAAIDTLAAFVESRPEVGIAGPRVTYADGRFQESYWRFPSLLRLLFAATGLYKAFPRSQLFNGERYAGERFEAPTRVDAVSGCVFLLRREVIERHGGLDEGYFMYFEETDLCRRATDGGYEVWYAPGSTFVHFLGGSSRLAKRRNFLEFRRSLVRFHAKHGGVIQGLTARALVMLWLALRLPLFLLRALTGSRSARARAALYGAGLCDMCKPLAVRSRSS